MKSLFKTKAITVLGVCFLMFIGLSVYAQDKNTAKAEEALKKAVTQKGEDKQDLLKKAEDLYVKSGLTQKDAYAKIADALVEAKDYTGAQTFYGRAGGDNKTEGFKKIADGYLEDAGSADAKNEPKLLKKVIDNYTKAKDPKTGYAKVGDYYMAKGPDFLQQALDNYEQGGASEQLTKIAEDFYSKGAEFYPKAAYAYEKTGTPEGYKKAGDIYWSIKDTSKAYAAYDKGNDMDGIKKYADALYAKGDVDAANAQYQKISDYYIANKNIDGLTKLAKAAFDKADYGLAAMYYEKMSDTKNAEKAQSYDALFKFDFDEAVKHFDASEDHETAKAIQDNLKVLQTLQPIIDEFELIKNNQPYVGSETNEVTGKKVENAKDKANFIAYYKAYISSVSDKVFQVSAAYAKLNNSTLKQVVQKRFLQYGAVRNLLNNDTFTKKKEKAQVKVDDIIM